jgi:hypothetical protein
MDKALMGGVHQTLCSFHDSLYLSGGRQACKDYVAVRSELRWGIDGTCASGDQGLDAASSRSWQHRKRIPSPKKNPSDAPAHESKSDETDRWMTVHIEPLSLPCAVHETTDAEAGL